MREVVCLELAGLGLEGAAEDEDVFVFRSAVGLGFELGDCVAGEAFAGGVVVGGEACECFEGEAAGLSDAAELRGERIRRDMWWHDSGAAIESDRDAARYSRDNLHSGVDEVSGA